MNPRVGNHSQLSGHERSGVHAIPSRDALQFRDCYLTFIPKGGREVPAVAGLTLSVGDGEFVAIVGPSGCGKSTALRLVTGQLVPDRGEVTVLGTSPDQARRKRLGGVVFQDPALLPWRTVRENVGLPLEVAGVSHSNRSEPVDRAISQVGLSGFEDSLPDQLSGGMRQRCALARCLTSEPRFILMDEPFSAVDELTRDRLNIELLDVWTRTRAAILFVTHSIEEAVFLADRVVVVSRRPARVVSEFPIPLVRPRPLSLKRDTETFNIVSRIRLALEEASR